MSKKQKMFFYTLCYISEIMFENNLEFLIKSSRIKRTKINKYKGRKLFSKKNIILSHWSFDMKLR